MQEEITAEFTREELSPESEAQLEVLPLVKFVARTDMGKVRENNEDKFDFFEPEEEATLARRGSVYLVCDGMGGHEAGQIASELACKTFLYTYYHSTGTPQEAAHYAAYNANEIIYRMGESIPSRRGMGTTLTALIVCQSEAIITHVGDSRCYLLRDDTFRQITQDHTLVNQWVQQGLLSPEGARHHPYAHMLTQALGVQETVEPDIETLPLQENDLFLLCTDGLTEHLSEEEIAEVLRSQAPANAAWTLVDRALAQGGTDNVTVALIQVKELRKTEVNR